MTILIGAFRWVLAAAIPGCVLVLLILLVKRLFGRKVNASFHFGIWFLLIIRLLIPFTISVDGIALFFQITSIICCSALVIDFPLFIFYASILQL